MASSRMKPERASGKVDENSLSHQKMLLLTIQSHNTCSNPVRNIRKDVPVSSGPLYWRVKHVEARIVRTEPFPQRPIV